MAYHIYSAMVKTLVGLVACLATMAANASVLECSKPALALSGQECLTADDPTRTATIRGTASGTPTALPAAQTQDFSVNRDARSRYTLISFPLIGILLLILLVRARSFNSK